MLFQEKWVPASSTHFSCLRLNQHRKILHRFLNTLPELKRREPGELFEIADEVRLIGILLLESDVGKLVVTPCAELVKGCLEAANPSEKHRGQPDTFLETPFQRALRNL